MTDTTDFAVLHEFVKPAKAKVSEGIWDYLMGGADTETTLLRNRLGFDSLAFRPRVLRDVEHVDLGTMLLGTKLRLPVMLAPIGSLQDLVPEGGLAPARAAAEFGIVHMLSSVCAPGLKVVSAEVDHPKYFQLYVRGGEAWVDDMVAKAIDCGYAALCLTVDLDYYGRRERDLAKRFMTTGRYQSVGDHFQGRFSWRDIERIREKCSIPLMLKGIATPEDAELAIEHGVEVVYVSNHGGRQLDHGPGMIEILPEIVEAAGARAEIVVDGGIMRGTDIVKAMALGADAVGIGRLQGLALCAAGQAGLVRMLELLEDETRRCLGLLGVKSFAELDRSYVVPAQPIHRPWLASAFPLLDEGY